MEAINNLSTEVVIVGAGPTGLMAAILLQQSKVKFRILDKSVQQAHESRAFIMHARSLELLQKIGLIDKFLQRGVIAPGVQLFGQHGKVAQMDVDDIGELNTPYAFLFMCPQSEIEAILLEYLTQHHISVEYNTEVIDVQQHHDIVHVIAQHQKESSQTITCRYLIGADGAHSVIRHKLQLDFLGDAYTESFLLADCEITWPWDYEHVKLFLRNKALAAYLPIKGKTLGRIIVINPYSKKHDSVRAQQATTAEPATLAEVQAALNAATSTPITLSNPQWISRYRVHHRAVSRYFVENIFIAGDAAHIHSPAGGQGMNTGLQDAANLVWKIALALKSKNPTALLETYQTERWPIGQKLLQYTDRLFAMMSSQKTIIAWVRTHIFPYFFKLMTQSKKLRYRVFHFISQLGIHYHPNGFLHDRWPVKNRCAQQLSAGHRAPNANIARHLDVFDLTRGYYFHILLLSKKSLSKESIDDFSQMLSSLPNNIGLPLKTHFIAHSLSGSDERIMQAESNQIFENYGLNNDITQAIFLIRPDGYIAYRSHIIDGKELTHFLQRFISGEK